MSGRLRSHLIYALLTALFFTGLVLTLLEIRIYRRTVIDSALVGVIWLSGGLIAGPFTSDILAKYYETKGKFLRIVYNTVAFGGIVAYCFMALNFYFPSDNHTIVTAEIVKKGRLAKGRNGCGEPYAHVLLRGVRKELVFPCGFGLANSKYVRLAVKKGFLGFDVIADVQVVGE